MFYDPILAHYDAVASLWEVPRIPLAIACPKRGFVQSRKRCKKLAEGKIFILNCKLEVAATRGGKSEDIPHFTNLMLQVIRNA
jgi:hypothetical protein